MLLLVDGYNVTMRDPDTAALSKEGQRDALVARLRVHAPRLAPGGQVVVVFDARAELGHSTQHSGAVKEVFARDADDEIVRRCAAAGGEVAVVTSDMRLRARISQDVGRHIRFLDSSEVFDGALSARSRKAGGARIAREAGMPQGANKITEELKKLWLSEED